ncbi:MAG: SigE family RNA polymerase sigma factor [Nocardioidaceae bacterium]|nr:SigE family RNA polymerase sigma factor [Nocardioidaceae bacterium]
MNSEHEARFCEFVAARQHALLRTAYLLTSDHHAAEDLVQTALAKAYLSWHKLREPAAADRYVRRIMVNENTSLWRRAWKRNEHATEHLPERAVAADATHEVDTRDELWALVQTLPPRQRAAVVLRYYEDLSEADTAAALGCSVGNVKSQTSRAIAALRGRTEHAATHVTGGTR